MKLLKCTCGKKPKLEKKDVYRRYSCACGLSTFFSMNKECAKELWCSQIKNIDKLKIKI
jgi:hypothetical protein